MGLVSSSTGYSQQSATNTIISGALLSVKSNIQHVSQKSIRISATSQDWLVQKNTENYVFLEHRPFKEFHQVFQAFFTDEKIQGHIKLQTRQFWKYLEDRIGYFYCKFPELKEMGKKLIEIQNSEKNVENQTDRVLALIKTIKEIDTRISTNKDLEMEVHKQIGPFVRNCYYEIGGIFSVYLEITPLKNPSSLGSVCSKALGATIFGSVHTSLRIGVLHWTWLYYNSLVVKSGVAIVKGSYESAYPEYIRGLQLPLCIFSPVNSYKELGLNLINRSRLHESGSPTEPFIQEYLEPMNQEIFSLIKQKFPVENLEKFCMVVVEYNTKKEYHSVLHNCQHFCDDLIHSLNLNYYDLKQKNSLLEEHLNHLLEHPKDVAPLKLGENAAQFLLNISDPLKENFVRDNIAYCLVACRYFICLLSRIIIKHKCNDPEEQQLQQEEEAALYKEKFFDFRTLIESLTEVCAKLIVSWKNEGIFDCDESLLAKCYSFASQRYESMILETMQIGPTASTCLQTAAGLIALHPPEVPSYETHPNLKWIYCKENATLASVIIAPRDKVSNKTIIYSHGNAEDMGSFFKWADYLANKIQVNFLLYDYRGYGLSKRSNEKINISTIFEDLFAVFQYVVAQKEDGIILWGRSLGGAPTVDLLAVINQTRLYKDSILGAVLQSTFASGTDLMLGFLANSSTTTLDSQLATNNEEKIKVIDHPILIIHGMNDTVVPISHAQRLKKFAKNATLVELEGDHNNLEENNTDLMVATLSSWIDSLKPMSTLITSKNK